MLDRCLLQASLKPLSTAQPKPPSPKLIRHRGSYRIYRRAYSVQVHAASSAAKQKRRTASVLARVGTVTFGPAQPVTEDVAEDTKPELQTPKERMVVRGEDYLIGPLNGAVTRGSVTFRPGIQYFRWQEKWHIIPARYDKLPEKEMHRRMKIKLRNTGRVPWNCGRRWSPEEIQQIRERTIKAMGRTDVKEKYAKGMGLRWTALQAAANKRIWREEKLRAKTLREDPPKPRKRRRAPRAQKKPAVQTEKTVVERQRKTLGPQSEKHRRNISDAIKKKWMDSDYRERVQGTKTGKSQVSDKECREKYDELMETIVKLTDEINALEAQRLLVISDEEVVQEIDEALESSRKLIEKVRDAVKEVEERLGIKTSPLHTTHFPIAPPVNGFQQHWEDSGNGN